jgi:two-component system, LytTR family, sensor kinase
MKKSFILALHIGYWVLYLLLITLFILFIEAGGMARLSNNQQHIFGFIKLMIVLTLIPGVIGFYGFYNIIFTKYLSQKRIAALCIYGVLFSILTGLISLILLNLTLRGFLINLGSFQPSLGMVIFMSILALIHGIIALVMRGFIKWYGDIKLKEQLLQKNFETELALVKSQLSPHFLFNSINNIDVLIKKDADKASEYLNKLSDIMRFMLYETKTEKILLQQELTYINKYIDLQKIRTSNINFVKFNVEGDIKNRMIAPMLFIPFIENAFKYAVNKTAVDAITVSIKTSSENIEFCCENYYSNGHLVSNETGGLGNDLLKKRLNLLYPDKHELIIQKQNQIYKVHLTIYTNDI